MHQLRSQLQNFVFTFFFGWLCHFQRWVFFWKTLTQKKFHSIDIFFNFCKCSKDVKASIWWWPFTFLTSEVQFWIKSTAFLFFIYFFDLVFQDFSSLTLIPQFRLLFSFWGLRFHHLLSHNFSRIASFICSSGSSAIFPPALRKSTF